MEIKFTALVSGKKIVHHPQGGKRIKIDLIEEKELPPPVFLSPSNSDLPKEVFPLVKQVIKMMPIQAPKSISLPRLTVWLTEDEWDALDPKPEVGETLTVSVSGKEIKISRT